VSGPERITRRAAAARIAAAALLPLAAPAVLRAAEIEDLVAILARSRLGPATGFAVGDAATGAVIEAHGPDLDRPPASVVKILTALYALDALGPGHRFRTALAARGDVQGGRLTGLALVGGGDPVLDTDALAGMAARLKAGGVRGIDGALATDAGALPALAVTEADQPAHAGYNPAVSGLNLNFNRVHLAWEPDRDGPALAVTAPGSRHTVPVTGVRVEIGGTAGYAHRFEAEAEVWRLAPGLARGTGSVWLPVRRPPAHAGEVFAHLASRIGLDPAPGRLDAAAGGPGGPGGKPLVVHESPDVAALMRGMLRYSTNLTAETVGLAAARASGATPASLADAAGAMERWARDRYGLRRARFINHSGLTTRSTLTARETLRILAAERDILEPLLPERPILDARGEPLRGPGGTVRAKTGTMHYLRGLAGYLDGRGRRLAFAIYAADPDGRAGLGPASLAPPPGARDWLARARAQENALLRRWAALHAG
jgi:serine-type D-Ala-D-Ala carboxypeptidase/endopeptidase (penicillin-binding protein 4)